MAGYKGIRINGLAEKKNRNESFGRCILKQCREKEIGQIEDFDSVLAKIRHGLLI